MPVYCTPALVLMALLMPAFGYLYLRFRDTRALLWLLGFAFALASMLLLYHQRPGSYTVSLNPWLAAAGQAAMMIASALFLGSLSPQRFCAGRFQILYVIPYTIPLVVAAILLYGVWGAVAPRGWAFLPFPALGACSFATAIFWGARKRSLPVWLAFPVCLLLGALAFSGCFIVGGAWALTFVQCANLQMSALLLIFAFRRFSPGVFLSVMGFAAWSLTAVEIFPPSEAMRQWMWSWCRWWFLARWSPRPACCCWCWRTS